MFPSNLSISYSMVVPVRSVPSVTYRCIKSSVRRCPYITKTYRRSSKPPMERTVNITSVVHIYKTIVMTKYTTVIIDVHSTDSINKSIVKVQVYRTDLIYTTVEVIKYRNIFYLDYSTKIIELHIRVVIES